jgi:hypothetical protein
MNALKKLWLEALAQKANEARPVPQVVDALIIRANNVLKAHGVEPIRREGACHSHFGDAVALYVNTGGAYDLTLLYDVQTEKFQVTSWGDWVEAHDFS